MSQKKATYIIIGAGLSGLTAAYALHKQGETDILILESRDRVGGRILTKNKIDLGATWFQNYHENIFALLDDLKLEKFHQYSEGKSVLVYSSMAPAHYFENDPSYPSAYRISGGSSALIEKLAAVQKDRIHTNTTVSEIATAENYVTITTNTGEYIADKVIITIPPRIATQIQFSPKLPETLIKIMSNTHTWMSNAIKVGLTFETPFWKAKKFSGTLIGQVGCVTELYDHCDAEEKKYALMGFVNEALRDATAKERKSQILDYLQKYLGNEILNHLSYEEKDWSQDSNTSCAAIKSIYMSPRYGNPAFQAFYGNGKLLFSGAETSPIHGGYMDGAVYSGFNVVKKILS
ncbi:FAD-dependent oxidoreductase [Kordia sp. YSTF-M3]|uniref:FAD-dependent oxidoreductase n=1 Tax=Kordia aestuariivivens TaxID=2759037 RepID=A0ABR7QDC3_9FLAO|nr:NAD(P)/FAD-dependent oxidoreductase [Kordia aestuariivivens]MBC8756532.1 FAD-dependent oxidoreductase [Kordia aestuariivivens]